MTTNESNASATHTTLPVHEVIEIVRNWLASKASVLPNFAGAYLWAGITALPADAPFALYRDVDVVVVLTEGAPKEESEEFYRGLSIEIIWKNLDEHRDVETILANPSAGPNMAVTQILADPTGILTPLQQAVAARIAEPRWILARCEAEKRDADEALDKMRAAATPAERLDSTRALLMAVSGLLALACLRRPTTRRTLALLRELLEEVGRTRVGFHDLNEQALIVQGSATMTPAEVRALLAMVMNAHTRAAEVYKTHIPYGFALRAHLRPYYEQGSLEMIEEGNHREAVFWITCFDTPFYALANDAPEDEKPYWAARFMDFYAAVGMDTDAGWAERVAVAEGLVREVGALVDEIAAENEVK